MRTRGKPPVRAGSPTFWALLLFVLSLDVVTKTWAAQALVPRHIPHDVIGDVVRFTLSYNPGAAFGMSVGAYSRWFFGILAVFVIALLWRSTREIASESRLASIGVPLVIGGALGNLLDRVRSREGVVDFIDIGVGDVRFWTFNIADAGVTIGASCLVIALWQLERRRALSARGTS